MTEPSLILAIDDDPQNLRLLNFTLTEAGYQVAVASSGQAAFRVLEKRQPDLVLCDVIMPEMNGYEFSRSLKENETLRDIPLIFLTSRTETEDLLAGFEAGAVDYVTKPFNKAELLARVRTHTELKRARDTILSYNRKLTLLNEEKNHFLGIAAHDLKNPLTTIILSAEMVELKIKKLDPESLLRYTGNIKKDADRMRMIITNLLDVNKIESGHIQIRPSRFDACHFANRLVDQYLESASRKGIKLELSLPAEGLELISDESIAFQIADNLLSNAVKYSPPDTTVSVSLNPESESLVLCIQDQGPGFTDQDKTKLFQKFAQLSARPTGGENSTGLGLSIVKLLCQALGGEISCESSPGAGACFSVRLPQHALEHIAAPLA